MEASRPDAEGSPIQEPSSPLERPLPSVLWRDAVTRMMATDTLNYLPNDILTNVTPAAIAASLETRAPFLDHRVAELTWRLPMAMRIGPGEAGDTSKWVLRQALYKYVPPELFERPKADFGIAIGHWLCGPLRNWVEELLEPGLLQRQGCLRPEPIQGLWRQQLTGRFDHTGKLWTLLMWQAWLTE
jgi:asparagine synthase (glutamine-hydrolysing)